MKTGYILLITGAVVSVVDLILSLIHYAVGLPSWIVIFTKIAGIVSLLLFIVGMFILFT